MMSTSDSVSPPPTVAALGDRLYRLVEALVPLRRCLTGDGLRKTLARLAEEAPVAITEVATGTPVLDWTIPPEWHVREAYLATPDGRRIVDWADSALHVVQYSQSVHDRMTLAALRPHLHSLPERPDWVPYRTSYYTPAWGFCLAHRTLDALAAEVGDDTPLEVVIDADHRDGSLTYGEIVVPGETEDEILLSAHACHPHLANDNAASLAVAAALASDRATGLPRRYTLRVLVAPGTLGAIAWLHQNRATLARIRHGLVLANLGDGGSLTYKQTRRATLDGAPHAVDRAVALAARDLGVPLDVRSFSPTGYDERQFASPGIDLPVGRLTRTPHGEYPEYHTSADDLTLVRPDALAASYGALAATLDILDGDARYRSRVPDGEPQLGRRGLYAPVGGQPVAPDAQTALLWVLNLADGSHSLLDAAVHSGLPFRTLRAAADRALAAGLLDPADA